MGKLWNRKRKRLTGPFKAVLGAIVSTEVTKGPAGWHPHFHVLLSMRRTQRVDVNELREEWCKLTGGRQIRLDVLKTDSDVVEVFKYAVKPVDVDSVAAFLKVLCKCGIRFTNLSVGLGSFVDMASISIALNRIWNRRKKSRISEIG